MREPGFWSRPGGVISGLLSPVGAIYGAVAAARMARKGYSAGVPVVCIGNLTVGGAGKTPAAIAVARWLAAAGRRPFLLSRGYGGASAGPVRVDSARHTAEDVGDEPLLLARAAPTIVARDRRAGAIAACEAGAGSIVMDDGFQNSALAKNLSILMIDARRGIGNGRIFPAGPLRAPLATQLARAHAVLVMGEGTGAVSVTGAARGRDLPVFYGRLEPDPAALAALRRRPVLAFAGIADPEKFFATLRDAGIEVRVAKAFPDHHRYRQSEAVALAEQAEREQLALVTTEKDLARLGGQVELAPLALARALPVTLAVTEERVMRDFVLTRMG
jgi:tetraacyldisaccharide 4'-kinase